MIEIVYTTNSSLWNCHIVNSAVGLVLEQTVCLHPERERESEWTNHELWTIYYLTYYRESIISYITHTRSQNISFKKRGSYNVVITIGHFLNNWLQISMTSCFCIVLSKI